MKPIFILLFVPVYFFFSSENAAETKYFASFDGTKIAYTDEGTGMPVVLIHGFISNRTSWNNTVLKGALLEAGYRVIVPDLRGNGESDKPHKAEAYANDAEIKDMKALADELKLKKYYAVGYSRGAIVLAKLLTVDKRVKKAVLGGMGADFTNPNWERKLLFAKAFTSGQSQQYPEAVGAVNHAKSIGADTVVLGYLQIYQPVTSKAELAKIKKPVLVLAGDKDVDNGRPQELQALLPKSTLQLVPGVHNDAHKSTEFATAVLNFLD